MAKGAGKTWKRATRKDLPQIANFILAWEERCVGLTSKLIHNKTDSLSLPANSRVFVHANSKEVDAVFLYHDNYIALPFFMPGCDVCNADMSELLSLLGPYKPLSAVGVLRDLDTYIKLINYFPRASKNFNLMRLGCRLRWRTDKSMNKTQANIQVRKACEKDLESLWVLQEGYEKEEVLTPYHRFDARTSRASVTRALQEQILFLALEGGKVVAKAGTNARGWALDQIGGVYTLPEKRGRGIARVLLEHVLEEIISQGRQAVLFVNPLNKPALSLYEKLGFYTIDDYRVDYFQPA